MGARVTAMRSCGHPEKIYCAGAVWAETSSPKDLHQHPVDIAVYSVARFYAHSEALQLPVAARPSDGVVTLECLQTRCCCIAIEALQGVLDLLAGCRFFGRQRQAQAFTLQRLLNVAEGIALCLKLLDVLADSEAITGRDVGARCFLDYGDTNRHFWSPLSIVNVLDSPRCEEVLLLGSSSLANFATPSLDFCSV